MNSLAKHNISLQWMSTKQWHTAMQTVVLQTWASSKERQDKSAYEKCWDLIPVHLLWAYHFLFLLHHSTSVSFPVMSLHSFSFLSRVLPILDWIVSLYAPVEIAYRQPLAWKRALSLFVSCQVGLIVLMYHLYRHNLISLCITPGYTCYSVYQVMGPA